jgi:hypothetical protein
MWQKLKKYLFTEYQSDLDLLRQDFITKHPQLSASQQAEFIKHQQIYQLRDNAN